VPPVDQVAVLLVAVGLTRLREQDQRRRVRGLRREDEVQEDERFRVPVVDERDRVERDPQRDDDRLADDVARRPEEARSLLGDAFRSVWRSSSKTGLANSMT